MQPSSPEPDKKGQVGAHPDLLSGQQLPPLPKQERSRKKRDALLQSALLLFAQRGYEETSIEEIAHHAKVAVGGFYQHFASKRQILLVLMDQLLQQASNFTAQASEGADLHDVRALIASLVRQGLQLDWAYTGAYRAWREAAVQDRELRELNAQVERWLASQLEVLFQGLVQMPGARQGVDVATLSWEIALLFFRLAEVPLNEPDQVNAVVGSLTHLIHHALFLDT